LPPDIFRASWAQSISIMRLRPGSALDITEGGYSIPTELARLVANFWLGRHRRGEEMERQGWAGEGKEELRGEKGRKGK